MIPSYELARIEDECKRAGVFAEYTSMVERGTSPRAAAMYALQQPAGTRNTDRAFCQGAHKQMENMTPINRQAIQRIAKRAGISTDGKYYKGGLGRYNDPAAWVSCADDVLAVAKAKNLDIEGVLNHKAVHKEVEPPKSQGLAPDIVQNIARDYLASDPALAERCSKSKHARLELREQIIDKHGRRNRPKKPNRLKAR